MRARIFAFFFLFPVILLLFSGVIRIAAWSTANLRSYLVKRLCFHCEITTQYKQYIANTRNRVLYCDNMAGSILYCHNMQKCILYGMYCRILFYRHIIYHTAWDERTVLAQLRTNMIRLNVYLHRIQAVPSNQCGCGLKRETIKHFLFRWPKWESHRKEMNKCTKIQRGNISFSLGGKSSSDGPK